MHLNVLEGDENMKEWKVTLFITCFLMLFLFLGFWAIGSILFGENIFVIALIGSILGIPFTFFFYYLYSN